jgi:hypothetical protein
MKHSAVGRIASSPAIVVLVLGVFGSAIGWTYLSWQSSSTEFYPAWTWSWAWGAVSSVADWPALAPGTFLLAIGGVMVLRKLPRGPVLWTLGILGVLLVASTMAMCVALTRAG